MPRSTAKQTSYSYYYENNISLFNLSTLKLYVVHWTVCHLNVILPIDLYTVVPSEQYVCGRNVCPLNIKFRGWFLFGSYDSCTIKLGYMWDN